VQWVEASPGRSEELDLATDRNLLRMVKFSRHSEVWASEVCGDCNMARTRRKKMMVAGFIGVVTIVFFLNFSSLLG